MTRRGLLSCLLAAPLALVGKWRKKPEPEWVKMGFKFDPQSMRHGCVIDGEEVPMIWPPIVREPGHAGQFFVGITHTET